MRAVLRAPARRVRDGVGDGRGGGRRHVEPARGVAWAGRGLGAARAHALWFILEFENTTAAATHNPETILDDPRRRDKRTDTRLRLLPTAAFLIWLRPKFPEAYAGLARPRCGLGLA